MPLSPTLRELSERSYPHPRLSTDDRTWRHALALMIDAADEDFDEYEDEQELPASLIYREWVAFVEATPQARRYDRFHNERCEWTLNGARELNDCTNCGALTLAINVTADGYDLCGDCNEGTFGCQHCDAYFYSEQSAYDCCQYVEDEDDDDCNCPECRSGGSSRVVHDYSYKPCPQFHGNATHHYGVEIEIEATDYRSVSALAEAIVDSTERDYYLKSDGSLDHGVEMVTHPRSLTSWQEWESELGTILATAARNGATAWDAPTAGLHVHVSRTAFLSEGHLYAFASFIEGNASPLARFAGRRSEQWASFDKGKRGLDLKDAVKPYRQASRYMAVNLNNDNTVELRFFRPSLKVRSVLAAVELVDAIVLYTQNVGDEEILDGALEWTRFATFLVTNKSAYPAALEIMTRRVKARRGAPIDPSQVEE